MPPIIGGNIGLNYPLHKPKYGCQVIFLISYSKALNVTKSKSLMRGFQNGLITLQHYQVFTYLHLKSEKQSIFLETFPLYEISSNGNKISHL